MIWYAGQKQCEWKPDSYFVNFYAQLQDFEDNDLYLYQVPGWLYPLYILSYYLWYDTNQPRGLVSADRSLLI